MDFLFHAHSGFRYVVLLVGFIALVVLVYALVTRKSVGATRGLMAAFVGVVDVQVLLGIILVFLWPFYGALIGHIVMMVLAAAVAHIASVMARRKDDPQRAVAIQIGGVVAALVIIVFGIQAIGRSVF